MYTVTFKDNNAYLTVEDGFDLGMTLDCGQAFRFYPLQNGRWCGIAHDRYIEMEQINSKNVILYNTDKDSFERIWKDYFDLERDYSHIIAEISENEILKTASQYGNGIRVLKQPPWETLCSFILSQNNNIKRIRSIIERLTENFGEKIPGGYTFPTPERLAMLTVDDLTCLRAGFRAKYILDAAKKVSDGAVNLEILHKLPYIQAQAELMKICGVGPKVADCTLLFTHAHLSAFPKDVWINRALDVLFHGELPQSALPYAGIVQQYIFFYAKETKLGLTSE